MKSFGVSREVIPLAIYNERPNLTGHCAPPPPVLVSVQVCCSHGHGGTAARPLREAKSQARDERRRSLLRIPFWAPTLTRRPRWPGAAQAQKVGRPKEYILRHSGRFACVARALIFLSSFADTRSAQSGGPLGQISIGPQWGQNKASKTTSQYNNSSLTGGRRRRRRRDQRVRFWCQMRRVCQVSVQ